MNTQYLERIMKGLAHRNRLRILLLLEKEPDLNLLDIAEKLKMNFKNAGEHTRKLTLGGLISKKYKGASVQHTITKRGKQVLKFCRTLE
jgi:DNA-binding transcriptional ArsR family regulator